MFKRRVGSQLRRARRASAQGIRGVRSRTIELLEDRTVLDASLQLIHNSPFDLIGTLDVYVDDVLVADNFAFQTARPFMSVTPGSHTIEFSDSFAPDNSNPFFSTTVNFLDNTSYVAIIEGEPDLPGAGGLNLAVSPLGRQFAQNPSNVEFFLFNGVPDAAPIDVVIRGGATLADNLAFPNFGADYVSVPPASYTLDVTTADGALGTRSFTANLTPAAGGAFVLAASDFVNPPPGIFGNPRFAMLAVFPDGSAFVLPELPPTVSVTSVSANEGNAGTTPFVFTVSLSAPATQPVTVAYNTANGTATAGSDYTGASGTLTFAVGVTTQLVTVQVTGDTSVEPNEAFSLNLSSPVNATLATASGTGTITNDDTAGSAAINFSSGFAGAAAQFAFNGTSSGIVGSNLRVTDSGTYRATSAYFRTPVSVNSFSTHFDFQLTPGTNPIGDGFTFVLQGNGLTSLGANGGGLGYAGINRSVAVKFDVYSNNGEGTNSTGLYTNGAQPTSQGSVNLNNTGIDLRSGRVFSADMTYNGTTLTVTITDRTTLAQYTRNYTVNIPSILGASTGYVGFTGGTGVRTAVQNVLNWTYTTSTAAPTPSVSVTSVSSNEGNSSTTPFVFAVSLSAASSQQVTVAYNTANGTATAGSDYTAASGTLTFAPGVTTQLVTVLVTGDTSVESNETFNLNLSSPVNATLATASGTGTIQNDDTAAVASLSVTSVSANEGNSSTTPFVFTVSLSAASSQQVTVAYATANGTATAGSDYTAISGTLTFAPGVITQLVTVQVTGDTTNEANEAFSLNLSSPVNATLATASGTGTITNDDVAEPASINFPSGFSGAASQFRFNGASATISGTSLQLTNNRNQAASAYFQTPINVTSFNTHFDFQIQPGSNPWGDGFTFVIQNTGLTALGSSGSGLGYAGIGRSVAVKFDIYNNAGEGSNSTGLYTNGTSPTSRNSVNLSGTGISLTSNHVFGVDMSYNGTTLTVTITDQSTGARATQNYAVDIPTVVGGSTAYIGFTGGTGSKTAIQRILNWTLTGGTGAAPNVTPLAAPAGMLQAQTAIAEIRESIDRTIYTSSQASASAGATAGGTAAASTARQANSATTPLASVASDETDSLSEVDDDLVELLATSCGAAARPKAALKA